MPLILYDSDTSADKTRENDIHTNKYFFINTFLLIKFIISTTKYNGTLLKRILNFKYIIEKNEYQICDENY